ncbi:MAG: hypothetical protein K9H49_14875 [Bacteroidales bacterium]|nr:hypothetical protein [Bacteroidales bacterium]MCF8390627.1 hypothetical protein [Bacteroidales bacterium]
MKNLNKLFVGLILVTAFVSCEKEGTDDSQILQLGDKKVVSVAITESVASLPVSEGEITPYIIPGKNKGGNRTCAEVGLAFMGDAEYFALCSDKVDYEEGDFEGDFPEGLNITTDGVFVSFEIDGCLEIGGGLYKVGAVIVKGSDDANVYWYPEGATSDAGLAAPINASGGPAGLSNLTFCFVECEDVKETLVIAVKAYTSKYGYTYSSGSYDYAPNCNDFKLGINNIIENFSFPMHNSELVNVGFATVVTYIENGITIIDVNLDYGVNQNYVYYYVGPISGIETEKCPDWRSWSLASFTDPESSSFTISY